MLHANTWNSWELNCCSSTWCESCTLCHRINYWSWVRDKEIIISFAKMSHQLIKAQETGTSFPLSANTLFEEPDKYGPIKKLYKAMSLSDDLFAQKQLGVSMWPSLWFFQNFIFYIGGNALLFVNFNIIIRHIFFWNFYWNSSSLLEDMKIFFVNVNYFHQYF